MAFCMSHPRSTFSSGLQTFCFSKFWHPDSEHHFLERNFILFPEKSKNKQMQKFKQRQFYGGWHRLSDSWGLGGARVLTKTLEELVDASLLTPRKRVQILLCSHLKQTWKNINISQQSLYKLVQLKEPQQQVQAQYLWGLACADPSPGWSPWTSGSPWTPPRTFSSSWR